MSPHEWCTAVAEIGASPTAPSAALGGPSWAWLAVAGALVAAGLLLGRHRRVAIATGVTICAFLALHAVTPATAAAPSGTCPLVQLDVTASPTAAEAERLLHLLPGDDVEWSRLTLTNTADRPVEVTARTRVIGSLGRHLQTRTSIGGSAGAVVLAPGEARPVRVRLTVPPLDNESQGQGSSFVVTVRASAR